MLAWFFNVQTNSRYIANCFPKEFGKQKYLLFNWWEGACLTDSLWRSHCKNLHKVPYLLWFPSCQIGMLVICLIKWLQEWMKIITLPDIHRSRNYFPQFFAESGILTVSSKKMHPMKKGMDIKKLLFLAQFVDQKILFHAVVESQ